MKSMANVEDYFDRMLFVNEAAYFLNVHPGTVRRWEKKGQLKSYHLGPKKIIRFGKEELDSFINHSKLGAQ
jgi:excisionase family DNA binding protein